MTKATKHPVYPVVEIRDALALLKAEGNLMPSQAELKAKYNWLFKMREAKIFREVNNPLLYGYKPSIWFICMALVGLDWMIPPSLFKDDGTRVEGGEAFGRVVRKAFGLEVPWDVLCVLGGNGSAKTHFECYCAMASIYNYPDSKVQMYHLDSETSRDIHQARMHEFLMPEDRGTQRSEHAYIAWKQKTGFSDNSFILPNRSECQFRYYEQKDAKPEGSEPGDKTGRNRAVGYAADELAPIGLINTLDLRLARFNSVGLIGFTPTEGYSTTVGRFVDGATALHYGKAFLVPRDNQGPLPEMAFQHEDCLEWFDFENGTLKESEKSVPAKLVDKRRLIGTHEGREFAVTPRVMRSASKTDGLVCFFTDDNRFLDPFNVWKKVDGKSEDYVFERYYGFTKRKIAGGFPLFDEDVHTIAPEAIPKEGTNYMICDPSGTRNMFMQWFRCTSDEDVFQTREWPCPSYAIPGEGFTGPWAEPSDNSKRYDGKMGPAQKNFGWSLWQYKKEIARLEGWECYQADATAAEVKKWDENGPAREKVYMRYLDARFGNADRGYDDGGQTNLFEQFDEIGLTFYETSGGGQTQRSIKEGVQFINDWLAYDTGKPVDFTNRPTLRINKENLNSIFAMKVWTGLDGQKGACKDPIDCTRMAALKHICYMNEQRAMRSAGGGCY